MFFNNQDIANVDMADKAVLYSCLCFFREFGEVGAAKPDVVRLSEGASAAFRRLCVETILMTLPPFIVNSAAFRRLCVETPQKMLYRSSIESAAFRRLCVETMPPEKLPIPFLS
ncbi:hypothetical protein, partial [Neisseria viridiae]